MLIRGDRQQIVNLIRNNTMCTTTNNVLFDVNLKCTKILAL